MLRGVSGYDVGSHSVDLACCPNHTVCAAARNQLPRLSLLKIPKFHSLHHSHAPGDRIIQVVSDLNLSTTPGPGRRDNRNPYQDLKATSTITSPSEKILCCKDSGGADNLGVIRLHHPQQPHTLRSAPYLNPANYRKSNSEFYQPNKNQSVYVTLS